MNESLPAQSVDDFIEFVAALVSRGEYALSEREEALLREQVSALISHRHQPGASAPSAHEVGRDGST